MSGTSQSQPVRRIGRYAMFGELASGGMATVHLGRLIGSAGFERTVAIKQMKAELADNEEHVNMFVDEARLASRIRHPNVVATLDVLRQDGELFMVLDYVHGETLGALVTAASARGERVPPPVVSAVMVQALLGLHAAHEAVSTNGVPLQLVHRDFSPQNVMVDSDGVARVVDFGVAKATEKLHLTKGHMVKGTWGYMSPEQVEGAPIDRRADLFSAGATLWETLTAQRLFSAKNVAQLAYAIVTGDVAPPSSQVAGCPPALDAWVMRALAKNPDDRFPTARAAAEALRLAVPPADVMEVASWLEATVGDDLRRRAELVAKAEKLALSHETLPESDHSDLLHAVASVAGAGRDAAASTKRGGSPAGKATLLSPHSPAAVAAAARNVIGDSGAEAAVKAAVAARARTPLTGGLTPELSDQPDDAAGAQPAPDALPASAIPPTKPAVGAPAAPSKQAPPASAMRSTKPEAGAGGASQPEIPASAIPPTKPELAGGPASQPEVPASAMPPTKPELATTRPSDADEPASAMPPTKPELSTTRPSDADEPASAMPSTRPELRPSPAEEPTSPAAGKRTRYVWLLPVAALLVGAAIGVIIIATPRLLGNSPSASSASSRASTAASDAPTAATQLQPLARGSTVPTATASVASPPSAPPSSGSAALPWPSRSGTVPPSTPPASKPRDNCNPNYTLRSDGVKVYKKECF